MAATPNLSFSRIYYLERACRMQTMMLAPCGEPKAELVWPREGDCRGLAAAFEGPGQPVAAREWAALPRMFDGQGADYAL